MCYINWWCYNTYDKCLYALYTKLFCRIKNHTVRCNINNKTKLHPCVPACSFKCVPKLPLTSKPKELVWKYNFFKSKSSSELPPPVTMGYLSHQPHSKTTTKCKMWAGRPLTLLPKVCISILKWNTRSIENALLFY